MSFQSAIAIAPADADFISYLSSPNGWVIAERRSDGIWDTCANLTSSGYVFFCAGVDSQRKALWSYESRQFITGTIEQLTRLIDAEEA